MAIENAGVIDGAGIEKATGAVVLTIADALNWDDESAHLIMLQEKLNTYFQYIESGQIWETHSTHRGSPVVIDVITRYSLPERALNLLREAVEVGSPLGITIRSKQWSGAQPEATER